MAVVEHVGRTSAREYRTPVLAFRTPDGFVIALVYGADSDWVRNALAAAGATLEHRGRQVLVSEPRLSRSDEIRAHVPAPIRVILRLLRVEDYLVLREAERA
jgi:deazaflavin-dependent oxidoreductase (nitroreductase family)